MGKRKIMWIALLAFLGFGGLFGGAIMSDVEQAKYTVLEKQDNIQIRQYEPLVIAEITMEGERGEAIGNGFRGIADYIFGNNSNKKQEVEKISMTAPVMQQKEGNKWHIRFVMPSHYTLETLPAPNNPDVKLTTLPAKQFVVITFSGTASEANIDKHLALLRDYMQDKRIKTSGEPVYAFFNPPFTLPALRRNEIMLEIAGEE